MALTTTERRARAVLAQLVADVNVAGVTVRRWYCPKPDGWHDDFASCNLVRLSRSRVWVVQVHVPCCPLRDVRVVARWDPRYNTHDVAPVQVGQQYTTWERGVSLIRFLLGARSYRSAADLILWHDGWETTPCPAPALPSSWFRTTRPGTKRSSVRRGSRARAARAS